MKTLFDTFFSYDDFGFTFHLFSLQHLIATISFAVIPITIIIIFRKKIQHWKHEHKLAVSIAVIGFIFEFVQYGWHYYNGVTDWRFIYPTTLCGLAIYLSNIAMITKNKYISSMIYFYSYGAFFSFLLADMSFGFNRFRFWGFFIIHGIILVNATYLIAVRRVRADFKSLLNSALFLVGILFISYLLNYLTSDISTKMNFFYLAYLPFEGPVFSELYAFHPAAYSIAVFISYFLLMGLMYGLAKLLKITKYNDKNADI